MSASLKMPHERAREAREARTRLEAREARARALRFARPWASAGVA